MVSSEGKLNPSTEVIAIQRNLNPQEVGENSMKTLAGKFSFSVPEGHPEAGTKVEKAFEYQAVENDTEAATVLTEKKLSLVELVNDKLKMNARSNAYQTALLPYRPSEVSPEEIRERTIRDLIRLGMSEDAARAMVTSATVAAPTDSAQ